MAKATLPTNYRDDILNVSTEGKRKYRMNYNDDGTVSFVDVTPYDQEGSDFGAGDINATNEAVNQSFDKSKLIRDMDAINALTQEGFAPDALALKDVNNSFGGLSFGYDSASGKYGYWKKEADTEVFVPFSSADFEVLFELTGASGTTSTLTIPKTDKTYYLAQVAHTSGAVFSFSNCTYKELVPPLGNWNTSLYLITDITGDIVVNSSGGTTARTLYCYVIG